MQIEANNVDNFNNDSGEQWTFALLDYPLWRRSRYEKGQSRFMYQKVITFSYVYTDLMKKNYWADNSYYFDLEVTIDG